MQHVTKKRIEDISEADLQAVTGGCATCAGFSSVALHEARKATNNASSRLGSHFAAREIVRADKLQNLAVEALNKANKPVIGGCLHCKDATSLMRRISNASRKTH
jgi:hypothetical protein